MAVFEGVVKKLGSGSVTLGGEHHLVDREYIDIGQHHMRRVRTSGYLDDLLSDALEAQDSIRLATVRTSLLRGGHVIVAARSADGTVRRLGGIGTILATILTVVFATAFAAAVPAFAIGGLTHSDRLGVLVYLAILLGYPAWRVGSMIAARHAV